jgi:hypothetical protein
MVPSKMANRIGSRPTGLVSCVLCVYVWVGHFWELRALASSTSQPETRMTRRGSPSGPARDGAWRNCPYTRYGRVGRHTLIYRPRAFPSASSTTRFVLVHALPIVPGLFLLSSRTSQKFSLSNSPPPKKTKNSPPPHSKFKWRSRPLKKPK